MKSEETLHNALSGILANYKANRDRDNIIWNSMSDEGRYGELIQLGCPPTVADLYAKRDLAIIPEPYFTKLMGL